VPRLLLIVLFAAALSVPACAAAATPDAHPWAAARGAQRRASRRPVTHRPAAVDPVALAQALAERYWGAVPCAGRITLQTDQPLPVGLSGTSDAWVSFQSSLGANDLQAPAATYSACTISLAAWQWPTRAQIAGDWNMFCLTVVHEMGHLLGQPHSLAPGSVMAPMFTDESSVPTICRGARAEVEGAAGS
jgi:hypothetical protein